MAEFAVNRSAGPNPRRRTLRAEWVWLSRTSECCRNMRRWATLAAWTVHARLHEPQNEHGRSIHWDPCLRGRARRLLEPIAPRRFARPLARPRFGERRRSARADAVRFSRTRVAS